MNLTKTIGIKDAKRQNESKKNDKEVKVQKSEKEVKAQKLEKERKI